ncbi:tetratricopeptide repeat protein [Pseudohoeflea coraliihabitans]|uniref:Tetratricopeptide repeat protein n=1 Tax=Pseudohoeflea coraliihabitans TaxID=2860393 RepID=A0ABS6WM58_9HYPH|nr:tetratricopeptide repeat protein [Pseudohoeflea sp. DP4N28-3]MBW3096985.1 tetratricopeptide repeat protein [Pseudohoeflea sp. DP4N28-3]
MSNDDSTFIREVNEELRSDALKAFWQRWRFLIIGLAILIIVGTAAERGWEYWRNVTAARSGDQYLVALELARQGKNEEALAAFNALEEEGHGAYPVLARMRAATVTAEEGDKEAAARAFLAIAQDSGVADSVRDVARVRAGYLLVDTGSYEAASAAVELLAVPGHAYRHSAREILGLAAFQVQELARARDWFAEILSDDESPANISRRAQIMLDLITARLPQS